MHNSEERNQFLDDVIEGAIYGCAYWARGKVNEDGEQIIWDFEEPDETFVLNRETIERGIRKVVDDPDFKVADIIRNYVQSGDEYNDATNVDAECADVIVQAALFDQIVFG